MKTIKKNSFLRIGLIFVTIICVFFSLWSMKSEQSVAQAAVRATANVHIGDMLEAKDYKMRSAGEDVYAEGMRIVYPSGGIYGSDKFVIEQAGQYQVTYYATVDDERIEETMNYLAIRRPQDMIVADKDVKVEYGKYEVDSPYQMTKQQYGAKVHFKAGQEITFATNLKTADLIEGFNFLEMIVQPSVYGETDFEKLTVRITDTADENNYVEYIINSSNLVDGAGMVSYVQAGAAGRRYGGWERTTFQTRAYGTLVFHSFRGWGRIGEDFANKTVSECPLTLAIDHQAKKLFCGPKTNGDSSNWLVNDLDDPGQYKSDPWEGFKGDEVSVTIKPGNFIKAEGVLLIKSFGGYNLANDVVDSQAPTITLDYDMADVLPVAEVGTDFPIIPFIARDALDKTIKTNVWVNHINENGKKITVEHDGDSFYVDYAGTYEIIYNAEDYSGNKTQERIEITAVENKPNIYIGIEEPIVEVDVYNFAHIPYVEDMNIYGGSGTLKLERAVYSPSKQLLEVKDTLQLTELGDYKVVYKATDYYGQVAYGVVTIRSTEIDAPKFVETPQFTDALLKDFSYDFPKAFVVETVDNKIVVLDCKTYVNGELVNGSFVADGTEMLIRYVAEGATGTVEWSDTIPVVDAESGKYKSKYFYSTDEALQVVDQKSSIEFVFTDNAQTTFINALSTQNLTFSMLYNSAKANFSQMTLTVTDAVNKDLELTVKFFYAQASNEWTIMLNNSVEASAYAVSKGMLSFTYSAKDYQVIDTNGEAIVKATAYDNGEEFKGFSDWVYITLAFTGVNAESSIEMTQICNQPLGYTKSNLEKAVDEIKPIIALDEAFLLRQELGSKAKIPTAKAFDVLGQICEFTVKVEKDGQLLASGAGDQALDLTLDKAGYYSVTYYAKDTNGNHMSLPYMILVSDVTAPTLTVKNSLKKTYNVGDKITIPTYSATDNGDNCYIQVMVMLPDDEMRILHYVENGEVTSLLDKDNNIYDSSFKANDNAFIAEKKGTYILRVVAYDEYYNYTVTEIEFQVK